MGKYNEALKATVAEQPDSKSELVLANDVVIRLVAKPLRPVDLSNIKRNHPDFMANPSLEGMVDLIIAKAREEESDSLVFDARDKPLLMRMDSTVITKAFGDLFGEQLEKAADEEVSKKMGN